MVMVLWDSGRRMLVLVSPSSSYKLQMHPLAREGAPTSTNPQLSDSNKNLVIGSKWVPNIKTDWLTDHR